jgi:hypothetical protein
MPPPEPTTGPELEPVTSLEDPRAIQILATEHWSLLTARSLAYNEAFTRGGMFLTFLSMSFVALALFATAMSFGEDFLAVAAVVLAFDLIIGLTTYGRIIGANIDDLRAVHGMARIRHGYTQIAPILTPYFTTGTHDDAAGVMVSYGSPPTSGLGVILYGLTTSGGMISLIVCLLGGGLAAVLGLMLGAAGGVALVVGIAATLVVNLALAWATAGILPRRQADLPVLFPTPRDAGGGGG